MNLQDVKRLLPEYREILNQAGGHKPRKFVERIDVIECPAGFNPSAQGDFAYTASFMVNRDGVVSSGPSYSYDSMLGSGVNPYERQVDVPRGSRIWVVTYDGQWGGAWARVLVFVHPDDALPERV